MLAETAQWTLQAFCYVSLQIMAEMSKEMCDYHVKNQHYHPLVHQRLKPQGKSKVDLSQCFSVRWYFKQTWNLNIHIDRCNILGKSNLSLDKDVVKGVPTGYVGSYKIGFTLQDRNEGCPGCLEVPSHTGASFFPCTGCLLFVLARLEAASITYEGTDLCGEINTWGNQFWLVRQ